MSDREIVAETGKAWEEMTAAERAILVGHLNQPAPKLDATIAKHTVEHPQKLRAVTAAELIDIAFPAREFILSPILQTQGTGMLYSKRGVGKTHLGLAIACAVAAGSLLLRWYAPRPRKVLYVDGEMPGVAMQERITAIVGGAGVGKMDPNFFRIITPDLQENGIPSLSGSVGQGLVEDHLGDTQLLILDNRSTLCRGGKENEAESWLPMQEWVLSLRRRGISVLIVDHAGRNGNVRGTSKREDVLDTIIVLRHPDDYEPSQGARFEVHIDKGRNIHGADAEPFLVEMRSDPAAGITWLMSSLEDVTESRVHSLLDDGLSIRDVAKALNIHRSKVERIKRRTR